MRDEVMKKLNLLQVDPRQGDLGQRDLGRGDISQREHRDQGYLRSGPYRRTLIGWHSVPCLHRRRVTKAPLFLSRLAETTYAAPAQALLAAWPCLVALTIV